MSQGDSDGQAANALRHAIARIERCIVDGALDKARILLAARLAEEGGADGASLNGGLAFLFDALAARDGAPGYGAKRMQYAQTALLLDPEDSVAHALLAEDQKILVAQNLIRHQRPARAKVILRRLRDEAGSMDAEHLISLLEYFDGEKQRIRELAPLNPSRGQKRSLFISVIAWGAAYVESLFVYAFPCLLASGNLPHASRDREIIFDFYTSEQDRDVIESHPVSDQIKRFARFEYAIVPESHRIADQDGLFPDSIRWSVAGAQQCAALRARRLGADLMSVSVSGIYSANYMVRSLGYLDQGYKAVVCAVPRTREPAPYARLGDYAALDGNTIEIDEATLLEFIVNNLHEHCIGSFISSREQLIQQNPVMLYFKQEAGFACRTYQPLPIIIANDLLPEDLEIDYFTADARILPELLGNRAPGALVKVVSGAADELIVTDVDCDDEAGIRGYGDIAVTPENCATGALLTSMKEADLDYYRWALDQRFEFQARSGTENLPDSDLDETAVMAEIATLISEGAATTRSRIRAFATLPPP